MYAAATRRWFSAPGITASTSLADNSSASWLSMVGTAVCTAGRAAAASCRTFPMKLSSDSFGALRAGWTAWPASSLAGPSAVASGPRRMNRWLRGPRAAHPPAEAASRHITRRTLAMATDRLIEGLTLIRNDRTYSSLLRRLRRFIKYSTSTTTVRAPKIIVVVLMEHPTFLCECCED